MAGFLAGMVVLVVWIGGMALCTLLFAAGEWVVPRYASLLAAVVAILTLLGFRRYGDDALIVGVPLYVALLLLAWRRQTV